MHYLKYLFDWNNHPIRSLYVLIPIVILKFGYLLAYSVAQITVNHYWVPLIITVLGFILFMVCVWPLYQIIRDKEAEKKTQKNQKLDEKH